MNAEFYSLDQTTLNHTVNMNRFSEDPQRISSIDFYTQEARTCQIVFYADDWSKANLRNVSSSNCIDNTNILKMTIKISNRVYYLQKSDIKYNKKNLTFTLRGIDLLGVLLILGNENKVFHSEYTDALELLETTIDEIFDADSNIQYSIDSSAASQSTSTTNFQINFDHNNKFTGEPEYTLGYYGIYEADIKWRWIGDISGEDHPIIYMVEFHTSNYDQVEENMDLTYSFIKFQLVDEILTEVVTYYHFAGFQDKDYVDGLYNNLVDNYGTKGFPSSATLNYSNTDGNYTITDSKLYFTGDVYFENIKIKEEEEDSGESELNQNYVLKGLLLLNNLYLYANGNTLVIGNKTSFGGVADETITNHDIIDYKEGHIVFRNIDFESTMSIFDNGNNLARFLNHYYTTLMTVLNTKIITRIENNYTLGLLDVIELYGYNFTIVKIHLDNDDFIYSIEGWR